MTRKPSVLHISKYPVAGMAYRIARALNLGSEWNGKLSTERDNGLGFPLGSGDRNDLAAEADIIHVHHIKYWREQRAWLAKMGKPVIVTVHGVPDTDYRRARYDAPPVDALTVVNPVLSKWWASATYIPNFVLGEEFPDRLPWSMKTDDVFIGAGGAHKSLDVAQDLIDCGAFSFRKVSKRARRPHSDFLLDMNQYRFAWDNMNPHGGNPGVITWEAARLGCVPLVAPSDFVRESIVRFFGRWLPPTPIQDNITIGIMIRQLRETEEGPCRAEQWRQWVRETGYDLQLQEYTRIYERVAR